MAGRPIWKTRSEYTDRLGISRGHIQTRRSFVLRQEEEHGGDVSMDWRIQLKAVGIIRWHWHWH